MDIAVFFWWVGSGLLGKHSCNLLRRIIYYFQYPQRDILETGQNTATASGEYG